MQHGGPGSVRASPRAAVRAAGRGKGERACGSITPTAFTIRCAYFETLQRASAAMSQRSQAAPTTPARPLPILVEKILERGERLPSSWPVDGTTGYEFGGRCASGCGWTPRPSRALTALYRRFTGDRAVVRGARLRVQAPDPARQLWPAKSTCWPAQLERIASADRRWRDFTLIGLTRALIEVLAAFPVYRTYLARAAARRVSTTIAACFRRSSAGCATNSPSLSPSLFPFLEDVLLLRTRQSEPELEEHERFAPPLPAAHAGRSWPSRSRTPPSIATTAWSASTRWAAIPASSASRVEDFHAQNVERARAWPLGMITTSTHDTKRGEDARRASRCCRRCPSAWRRAVRALRRASRRSAQRRRARRPRPSRRSSTCSTRRWSAPGRRLGRAAGPRGADRQRMGAFMHKASREAKQETSWTSPNPDYDAAVESFVEAA